MTTRAKRRTDALSKERIVEAATEILDTDGEAGLTFRALTARLSTGAGAIYWHVADKDELLAAATDAVIAGVLNGVPDDAEPRDGIRAVALGVFDAIDAHPWVGTALARQSWRPAMLALFESLGGRLLVLGVPDRALFASASALLNYVLGVAGQNAANARTARIDGLDRPTFLADVVARWTQHDPAEYPFIHRVATQLRDHDDREQFLDGVDLVLAGIATVR